MSDVVTSENRQTESTARAEPRFKWASSTLVAAFIVPAALVVSFLFVLISLRDSAEAAVSNLANLLPLGYAFGAGMVASVNPCGFFILPSYVSYQLGTEETGFYESSAAKRVLKALALGVTVTGGFILAIASVGGLISAGGQWLISVFPYAGAAVGAAMLGLGLWLLVTHQTIGIMAASRVTVRRQRSLPSVFLFGIAYAVGSLSCTLPIFLVVIGGSLASRGLLASFGQFVSYALGMGIILVAVTIGSALFRGAVSRWLRRAIPYVHRVSVLFLVGAGAYLIYYWVFYTGSIIHR